MDPMSASAPPSPPGSSPAPPANPVPAPDLVALLQPVGQGALATLVRSLETHPAFGWLLKDTQTLQYVAWGGDLPQADARLSRQPALAVGQIDADHFEPTQASLIRLADIRVLRQQRPHAEVHRLEPRLRTEVETVHDWRAWRVPIGRDPGWLLQIWTDQGLVARQDEALQQARQQIQAQQLLLAEMRAQLPEGAPWSAQDDSLRWSAERFAEQIRREADLCRREQRSFSLLLIELQAPFLDPAIEQAACAVLARQFSANTRAMDTVAQIGRRRFGVLLSGAALTPAYSRAEAIRLKAAEQVALQGGALQRLRLAVGVAAYPHTVDNPLHLQQQAEGALQEALDRGGDCSVMARVALQAVGPEEGTGGREG